MRVIISWVLLAAACNLYEEPIQQAKGALAAGDIVFDALDTKQVAVVKCGDAGCSQKNAVPHILHQVTLANPPEGEGDNKHTLALSNLFASFQQGNRTYTCSLLQVSLGKMTRLLESSKEKGKYCYTQAKEQDYVQRFAAACVQAENWQLRASDSKVFSCWQDEKQLSSACFVPGNSERGCDIEGLPPDIVQIHTAVKAAPSAAATTDKQPAAGDGEITGDTPLSEVKIMARWDWDYKEDNVDKPVSCESSNTEETFTGEKHDKKTVFANADADTSVEAFLVDLGCHIDGNVKKAVNITDFLKGDLGACILPEANALVNKLSDCEKNNYFIEITFVKKEK